MSPFKESSISEAAEDARRAIDTWRPRALIVVDDLAQALVAQPYLKWRDGRAPVELGDASAERLGLQRCNHSVQAPLRLGQAAPASPPMAVFYAGVNANPSQYGYDRASNATGVNEHKDIAAVARLVQRVDRASAVPARAVQLLNDRSATALAENERYASAAWAPLRWLPPVNVTRWNDWQAQVLAAGQRGAMLLIANYHDIFDDDGRRVPTEQVIAWTERHSRHAAVGAGSGFVSDGGLLTVAPSGLEQGEVVMEMALQYLRTGELMPPRKPHRLLIGLDRPLARKHQLESDSLQRWLQQYLGRFFAVCEQAYVETQSSEELP